MKLMMLPNGNENLRLQLHKCCKIQPAPLQGCDTLVFWSEHGHKTEQNPWSSPCKFSLDYQSAMFLGSADFSLQHSTSPLWPSVSLGLSLKETEGVHLFRALKHTSYTSSSAIPYTFHEARCHWCTVPFTGSEGVECLTAEGMLNL